MMFRSRPGQGPGSECDSVQRFGSGVRRRQRFSGNVIFDGPISALFASRGDQNGFEQECRRAFSIRAGDAGDGQSLGRLLVKIGTQPRQRPSSVGYLRPGHVGAGLFGS